MNRYQGVMLIVLGLLVGALSLLLAQGMGFSGLLLLPLLILITYLLVDAFADWLWHASQRRDSHY
ncbi:MAG: hypothetical protein J0L63_08305 [Anaerolineae bacterium]|nr:hypothetical protein [Anaerolineae bacterium]